MTHDDTIDWNRFWTDAEGDRRASAAVGQFGKADLLDRFFERVGVPDSFASVGCGPGAVPLAVARRHPADVYGYDAADSAVEQARAAVREAGVDATFETAALPAFDPGRRFDVVYCYATLHYVRDVEAALSALFAATAPGGHLVFDYPNPATREQYADDLDDDGRERFALVLSGESVLTREDVEAALDAPVHDYWDAVDAPDEPWTGPHHPCVYAKRPET
ncbi:class I SAM-dependent methyltransferase [Halorarius halobius]|uniref:class I SAM-dependent methyltransferase n=1 Tax=Halorarius halobius TaxID=2962671 RepID=UPI0020CD92E5|nr:class I SAM-dependent methyltransferase [Halorarius halobius]